MPPNGEGHSRVLRQSRTEEGQDDFAREIVLTPFILRAGEGSWRELPTKVEDDYHRWESDPRFREWMTNDLYRPVIGEAEVDTWRKSHAKRRH